MAEEQAKREAALERHALEVGETRWVLSVRPTHIPTSPEVMVTSAGFADIDEDDEDSEEEEKVGRVVFGKKVVVKSEEESDSSDDDDEEEEYDPLSVTDTIARSKPFMSTPKSRGNPWKSKTISSGGGPPSNSKQR
jgi:hypothetical protein